MNIEINDTDAWDVEILMYLNSIPESNRAAIVKMGLLGFFRQNYPAPSGIHSPILQPAIATSTEARPEPMKIEKPEPIISQPDTKINSAPITEPKKNKGSETPSHMQTSSLGKALIPDSALAKMKEEKRKARQKRLANR